MLLATTDEFVKNNHDRYCQMLKDIVEPITALQEKNAEANN